MGPFFWGVLHKRQNITCVSIVFRVGRGEHTCYRKIILCFYKNVSRLPAGLPVATSPSLSRCTGYLSNLRMGNSTFFPTPTKHQSVYVFALVSELN